MKDEPAAQAATEAASGIPDFPNAPFPGREMTVAPEWIDYNGHMNVGYYTLAFDRSLDELFDDALDIGAEAVRTRRQGPYVIQQSLHYIGELLEGQKFRVEARLIDYDAKKMHIYMEMFRLPDGALCATSEQLLVNVDLETRRSTPYPADALARIAALAKAQADLPRPERVCASVGIRRKA
jgi:acyl-CoA thioester hydrolase